MNILKVLTERRIKGNIGEDGVAKYLKRNGYKILRRNYVEEGHEIDIIAENKEYISFVEVKTRTKSAKNPYDLLPRDAVDLKKRKSIISSARVFASFQNTDKKFRFDVAEVYLDENKKVLEINYIENAFTLNESTDHRYRK